MEKKSTGKSLQKIRYFLRLNRKWWCWLKLNRKYDSIIIFRRPNSSENDTNITLVSWLQNWWGGDHSGSYQNYASLTLFFLDFSSNLVVNMQSYETHSPTGVFFPTPILCTLEYLKNYVFFQVQLALTPPLLLLG